MSDKILVIGGGFAGFWAALAARRVAGPRVGVTLLSREPVLEVRPRLYEAQPETLAVELLPLLREVDVSFVRGEALRLDTTGKAATLATGDRLGYDRLVVATGSRMRRPPVPGAEAAFSVDTQAEAIALDRRLGEIARTVAQPTIAVVGAGFTGIELALELRDRLLLHSPDGVAERLRIVLIDRAQTVGTELGPGPRPEIEAALADARVELRLGATISALAADHVRFADDSVLTADAVVLATGMAAAPFAAHVPGERDELGRVLVDAGLRAPAAPEVFVAGDAAAADTGDGHRTLQSCQHAGQLGRVAGENAARDLLGLPLTPYTQLRYVTCLDLGRSGAVISQGWERRVEKTGQEAKALKRKVNTQVIYPPRSGTAEALLASSSTNLAERAARVDGTKVDPGQAPDRTPSRAVGTMTGPPPLDVHDAREAFVDDFALESLIREVYVGGGFTEPDVADRFFTAAAIRVRGELLFVRDPASHTLVGTVIVVAPGAACRVAKDGEAEMQLLTVSAERRNGGIGGALVEAAVRLARSDGHSRMVLRTQPTMHAAHRLYARAGFVRAPERDMLDHGRIFLVYQMAL